MAGRRDPGSALPRELAEFAADAWCLTEIELADLAELADPELVAGWTAVLKRRHWQSARRRWLAEAGADLLPTFTGARSAEAGEWDRAVAAWRAENEADDDG